MEFTSIFSVGLNACIFGCLAAIEVIVKKSIEVIMDIEETCMVGKGFMIRRHGNNVSGGANDRVAVKGREVK